MSESETPCVEKPAEGSKHRDDELARVATEKKHALIKAWEERETREEEGSVQREDEEQNSSHTQNSRRKESNHRSKRGEGVLKAEEIAAKCQATGSDPKETNEMVFKIHASYKYKLCCNTSLKVTFISSSFGLLFLAPNLDIKPHGPNKWILNKVRALE
ncbi:hypothetical protein R6Q59_029373 [Mikania micrantha]